MISRVNNKKNDSRYRASIIMDESVVFLRTRANDIYNFRVYGSSCMAESDTPQRCYHDWFIRVVKRMTLVCIAYKLDAYKLSAAIEPAPPSYLLCPAIRRCRTERGGNGCHS